MTSLGWPTYYIEDYTAYAQAFQSQLGSLVCEGVFAKFPGLKVVLIESGVTWLPASLWRINKTWRGVRAEVPWLDRLPADIVRERVRLTAQPFDEPPDAAGIATILEELGSEDMLLFSSDYPHWHYEGIDAVPPGLPEATVRRMIRDNPLATYPRLA
jgi:predicted TIM-barrel fold metal-dependent hydrolase